MQPYRIPPQRLSNVPDGTTGVAPVLTPDLAAGGGSGHGEGAGGAGLAGGADIWATSVWGFGAAGCGLVTAWTVGAGFEVPAKAMAGFGFGGAAGSGWTAAMLEVASASGDGARGGLTFAGSGMLDGITGRKWPSLSNRASCGRSLARKVGCMPPSDRKSVV